MNEILFPNCFPAAEGSTYQRETFCSLLLHPLPPRISRDSGRFERFALRHQSSDESFLVTTVCCSDNYMAALILSVFREFCLDFEWWLQSWNYLRCLTILLYTVQLMSFPHLTAFSFAPSSDLFLMRSKRAFFLCLCLSFVNFRCTMFELLGPF